MDIQEKSIQNISEEPVANQLYVFKRTQTILMIDYPWKCTDQNHRMHSQQSEEKLSLVIPTKQTSTTHKKVKITSDKHKQHSSLQQSIHQDLNDLKIQFHNPDSQQSIMRANQISQNYLKVVFDRIDEILELHFVLAQWDKSVEMKDKLLMTIEDLKEEEILNQSDYDLIERRLLNVAYKFEKMDEEYEMMLKLLKGIQSIDWKLYETRGNIKLFYKNSDQSKHLTIKTEALIKSNLLNITSLIYQLELAHKWIPMLNKLDGIGYIDGRCISRIVNGHFGALGVKRNIQAGLYGVDRYSIDQTCIMILKDIQDDVQFMDEQKVTNYFDRHQYEKKVKINQMIFICKLISFDQCQLTAIQNIDTDLQFAPSFLIHYVTKKIGLTMFEKLQKLVTNKFEQSLWAQAILNRKEDSKATQFYQIMNKLSIDYFQFDCIADLQQKFNQVKKKL